MFALSTNKVLHMKVYASMANLILQQKCFRTKLALCISNSRHCAQWFVLDGTFAVSWADCEENKNNPFAKEDAEQTWIAEGRDGGSNHLADSGYVLFTMKY